MGGASSLIESEQKAVDAAKTFVDNHDAKIWSELDFNGNNIVSVAETHKFIEEHTTEYPDLKVFLDANGKCKQPPLIRAWAKVTGHVSGSNIYKNGHKDGFIHKHEFRHFIKYCFWYNRLFEVFEHLTGEDSRISLDEFKAGVPKIVQGTTPEDLEKTFNTIDKNKGGKILFDEFSGYIIASVEVMDMAYGASGAGAVKHAVKKIDHHETLTATQKKHIKSAFAQIDTNGNGKIGINEFKKAFGAYAEKSGSQSPEDDTLTSHFNTFDINRDGSITLDEFAHIIFRHS